MHIYLPPPSTGSRAALNTARRLCIRLFASTTIALTSVTFAATPATYLQVAKPITDEQGRVEVIIDFADDAHMKYPGALPTMPTKENFEARSKGEFFHTEKTLALVTDFEKRYGLKRTGMTSWVGNSLTAFVEAETIKRLQADPLVKQISQNQLDRSSSIDPSYWNDTTVSGGELISWGRIAVNGKIATQNTGRKIYIIDGGVALHDDLPTMTRLNVACGASGNCNAADSYTYPLTGCYAHATHVAGIIGATAGNGKTIQGAYAGFPNMVSLTTDTRSNPANNCTSGGNSDATQGHALDYIAYDSTYNNPGRLVHIATMSKNSDGSGGVNYQSGTPGANWYKVKSITTTIWAYGIPVSPGVFFVQSAGNYPDVSSSDACLTAYRPGFGQPAAPDDGVMVVGGADKAGKATSVNNTFSGSNPSGIHGIGHRSTHGACVDIWAPGNSIASTWGQVSQIGYGSPSAPNAPPYTVDGRTLYGYPLPYSGNVGDPYEGWAYMSGTSMAAPFVAAAAAWLADTYNVTTPSALETLVRAHSYQWGSPGYIDSAGLPVKIIQLP